MQCSMKLQSTLITDIISTNTNCVGYFQLQKMDMMSDQKVILSTPKERTLLPVAMIISKISLSSWVNSILSSEVKQHTFLPCNY